MEKKKIQEAAKALIEEIGEDPCREGLQDTWKRRIPDIMEELSEGYREEEKPNMRTFESENDNLVSKIDIPFYSLCEHHLLPFYGKAHIGYIPDGEVVGLSKLIRYTRWKSRKLSNQERLTKEIAEGLNKELQAKGTIVVTEAVHLCESMRGVEKNSSKTNSQYQTGVFEKQNRYRNEFLQTVRGDSRLE